MASGLPSVHKSTIDDHMPTVVMPTQCYMVKEKKLRDSMYLSFHIFVVHYTYTLFKNHSVSVASVSAWVAFHLLTVIFCSEHISRFFLKKGVKKDSKLALLGSFKMSKQTLYLAYGFQNIRDIYQTQL